MSDGSIKVNYGAMDNLSTAARVAALNLLGQAESARQAVLNTNWSGGTAQPGFHANMQKLDQGIEQLRTAIEGFGGLVGKAKEAYHAADLAAQKRMQSLGIA